MKANPGSRRHVRAGRDRWLISYADLVTLLFATFAILFASSLRALRHVQPLHEEKDFKALARVAGSAPPQSQTTIASGATPTLPSEPEDNLAALEKTLRTTLQPQLKTGELSVLRTREGLVISLREGGFFRIGRAQLTPQAAAKLQSIARTIFQRPLRLRIEGHSDNLPIHNADFHSNWELSTARAEAVLQVLLALSHTDPGMLSVAGYGPYHPIADNATAHGRADNRRVDIVVIAP